MQVTGLFRVLQYEDKRYCHSQEEMVIVFNFFNSMDWTAVFQTVLLKVDKLKSRRKEVWLSQWLACNTCNWKLAGQAWVRTPSKATGCFFQQETVSSLLVTGLSQEWIRDLFSQLQSFHHNQNKVHCVNLCRLI